MQTLSASPLPGTGTNSTCMLLLKHTCPPLAMARFLTSYVHWDGESQNSQQPEHLPNLRRVTLVEQQFWPAPICESTVHSMCFVVSTMLTITSPLILRQQLCAVVMRAFCQWLVTSLILTAVVRSISQSWHVLVLIHTANLPFVIIGDFIMTPAQLSATQWIDQVRGQIITPLENFSTCSNGGRRIV